MEEIKKTEKLAGYGEFKEAMDRELQKSVEGFVRIGFLLRLALETEILTESGYRDVYEFAQKEYGLDRGRVSRFININKEFSEGGYSDQLKEQYQGYGYTKLALMLQIPDTILSELSPKFSKAEIETIKNEVQEEEKVSDIEVLLEGQDEDQEKMESNLGKSFHQLFHDSPELYGELHQAMKEGRGAAGIQEALAPAGEGIHSVRLSGIGRMMMSVKGTDSDIALIRVRTNEKENFSWQQAVQEAEKMMDMGIPWEESWENLYGEELPKEEKPKVAPVQQKITEKPEQRKKPKVTKAKMEPPKQEPKVKSEPKQEPEPEENSEAEVQKDESNPTFFGISESEAEEPREESRGEKPTVLFPGIEPEQQMEVEDYPELLPEGYTPAPKEDADEEAIWKKIQYYLDNLNEEMESGMESRDIAYIRDSAKNIEEAARKLQEKRNEKYH